MIEGAVYIGFRIFNIIIFHYTTEIISCVMLVRLVQILHLIEGLCIFYVEFYDFL
jgi:hypothetical protein